MEWRKTKLYYYCLEEPYMDGWKNRFLLTVGDAWEKPKSYEIVEKPYGLYLECLGKAEMGRVVRGKGRIFVILEKRDDCRAKEILEDYLKGEIQKNARMFAVLNAGEGKIYEDTEAD